MGHMRTAVILLILLPLPARAVDPVAADYRPDPLGIQWHGPAYRYPQEGWIVLHIEGDPYERGYQHGRLLAPEIAAYLRCSASQQSAQAPADGWKQLRTLANALFLRHYEKEYLEEMKGIADGATAAGARFDDRPIDLVDIVALNAWPELDTLQSALEATPNGLEGMRFPKNQPRAMPEPKAMHCSAFAATGPATADGKVVFGHITMFGLYPSLFYNVWLDVKPTRGHRVLMQTYPGGIQSGLDYYMNDAGLLVCETTIAQTRFDINGASLASRIRQALQYADSIDKAVEILKAANNGLYTNEWLLADIKTNEIAMFELGTAASKLYRSSKNEWFGSTEGFYWGCNNTKELKVRLETVASVNDRPANLVWQPSNRDKMWQRLYAEHKGRIDTSFGKKAFTTPPLAAFHSLDAKFTTTELARDLKTWALFGPPLGRTWEPSREERKNHPEIKPMVSNPWTILHAQPPARTKSDVAVLDLPEDPKSKAPPDSTPRKKKAAPSEQAVWHGTILPKTDADIWLATAFADYERLVAREKSFQDDSKNGKLSSANRDRLAVELFVYRSRYCLGSRAAAEVPLAKTHAELGQSDWYDVAAGKGVLVLHELRRLLGKQGFQTMMDSFGREHAGQEITVEQFQAHAAKTAGKSLDAFFTYWTSKTGLPSLRLDAVHFVPRGEHFVVEGDMHCADSSLNMPVDITVETARGDVTSTITLDSSQTHFRIETDHLPRRVIVDKYGSTAKANGGPFSVLSFHNELEQTLIVYGTTHETCTNQEAALALQKAILRSGPNITVPVKADTEVSEHDLKTRHLLLIGRPDCNRCVDRFRAALPVTFGSRSLLVRGEAYAHPHSAVIMAAANPFNTRYSLVVLAGLSAESTRQCASRLMGREGPLGEVLLLPAGGKSRSLVLPAQELAVEVRKNDTPTR
jgi:hypothetical protein